MTNTSLSIPPSPTVDQVGVEERAARFTKRSIKKESKVQGLKMALSMMDLTTLAGKDTPGKVKQLCYKAMHLHDAVPGLPSVAAVCVYPTMVPVAAKALKGSGIHLASVATSFPSGHETLEARVDEVRRAVEAGADEIDMVISRGRFLAGEHAYTFDEVAAVKEACGKAHLKVILETGELLTYDNVRRASDIAMYAGGDFIKTSTGKVKPAATLPEAGRRHRQRQARAAIPRHAAGNPRPGLDDARSVALRRQPPRQRCADANRSVVR